MLTISPPTLSVYRVKWFRDRAARDRAREEKEILEEEFRRIIAYFGTMSKVWTALAESSEVRNQAGYSAYAYKQAAMYAKLKANSEGSWRTAKMKKEEYEKWYGVLLHQRVAFRRCELVLTRIQVCRTALSRGVLSTRTVRFAGQSLFGVHRCNRIRKRKSTQEANLRCSYSSHRRNVAGDYVREAVWGLTNLGTCC